MILELLVAALVFVIAALCYLVRTNTSHASLKADAILSQLESQANSNRLALESSSLSVSSARTLNFLDKSLHVSYGPPGLDIDVSLCPLPSIESLRKVDIPNVAQRNISDFVIESVKLFGQYTGTRTLAVQFSPEVARQLASGQFELMKSGFAYKACAINPMNGNRIAELGNIVSSVNPMAAAAFAWQVLAVITAQKFMSDINTKLAAIGNVVNEMHVFLIEHEESKLVANYEYLRQIKDSIVKGNLCPEDVVVIGTQLEDIERQSATTMHGALRASRRTIEGLKQKHGAAWLESGFKEFIEQEMSEARTFSESSKLTMLALAVRSSATYLRAILPLNKAIAANRLTCITDDLETYTGILADFGKRIYMLNDTMEERPWSPNNKSESIECGKKKIDEMLARLALDRAQVSEGIASVSRAMGDRSNSEVIYAEINGDRVSLFQLSDLAIPEPHLTDRSATQIEEVPILT